MNAADGLAKPPESHKSRHSRITWRLRRGFAAIAMALLCVTYLAFVNSSRSSTAGRWYAHTYQVLAELNQLQADIGNVDSGARGWASLGDPATKSQCAAALADYHARLRNLQDLTTDTPAQRQRLLQLSFACAAWEHNYILPLLHRNRSHRGMLPLPEVRKIVTDMQAARPLFNQIQTLTAALKGDEVNRLDDRLEEQEFSQRSALSSLIASAILVTILLASLFVMLDRSTGRMLRVNARLEDEIEERAAAEERLRESESRLKALIENTLDNVWSIDREYRLTNFNRSFRESALHRLGMAPFVGQDMTPFFEGENTRWKDWYDRAMAGERMRVEESYEVDGRHVDHELSFSPIETETEGGCVVTGATVYSRDITERKKVDRLKNEFIATVSHELRTPLTSIRGSLGLLRGGVAGDLPQAARSLIDIAVNNADRLVRLINDILDVEKIESGKIEFELQPLQLLPLVQTAIEGAAGYGSEMNVRFELRDELPPGARILADADRFSQVMDNLLSNASKFSPRGDAVVISLAQHGSGFRVSVNDKGPGVPPEFHDRIFSRFAQADGSDTRPSGGTGLGLSIVRAIVEKFGGTVDFERRTGPGCTFFFDLPEWHDDLGQEAANRAQREAGQRPRILHIENDPDVVKVAEELLKGEADLESATGVAAARAKLADNVYDLVILDIALPDGDGLDLLSQLNNATRPTPVVVFSASELSSEDARRTEAALVKSRTSNETLLHTIQSLISRN